MSAKKPTSELERLQAELAHAMETRHTGNPANTLAYRRQLRDDIRKLAAVNTEAVKVADNLKIVDVSKETEA